LNVIILGADCLLSDELLIRSADQHGIIDLTSNTIINNDFSATIVDLHSGRVTGARIEVRSHLATAPGNV
jgi:hypothetical protein